MIFSSKQLAALRIILPALNPPSTLISTQKYVDEIVNNYVIAIDHNQDLHFTTEQKINELNVGQFEVKEIIKSIVVDNANNFYISGTDHSIYKIKAGTTNAKPIFNIQGNVNCIEIDDDFAYIGTDHCAYPLIETVKNKHL